MKDRKDLMEKVRETILENFRLISGEKSEEKPWLKIPSKRS
jgi:hypothetical protein